MRADDRWGCVILEIKIPDVTGLDIQEVLASQDPSPPLIFLTSYGTISLAVHSMREGAVHFLQKPARGSELRDAIREAALVCCERERVHSEQRRFADALAKLTENELCVMRMMAHGASKKSIAKEITAGVRMVELHQSRLKSKLGLSTTTDLLRFALRAADVFSVKSRNERHPFTALGQRPVVESSWHGERATTNRLFGDNK